MPIANCIVASNLNHGSNDPVELWAAESAKSSDHMTINIVGNAQQFGNKYAVMAHLLLPSVWSSPDISSLQLGLAKALAKHFGISISAVHVITTVISSGMVVEDGKELQWQP